MFDPRPDGVPVTPRTSWQPSLLESAAVTPGVDAGFGSLRRLELDEECWLDHAPGWLHGADVLFAELLATASWRAREVPMYDRMVAEPRLTARWSAVAPAPLEEIRLALSARYERTFDGIGVNLYRDGEDSVAWHSDRIGAVLRDPMVATVSLGAPRRFLLRAQAGGGRVAVCPGPGDLLVMGGAIQHRWQHCVPKTRRPTGPRMAITIRHTAPGPLDGPGSDRADAAPARATRPARRKVSAQ